MKEEAWRPPLRVLRNTMSVRVVAVKTSVRDLKPGDLFSDKDGDYWNRAMAGHVQPQAMICTNEADDMDIVAGSEYVYRLSIVKESIGKEARDVHRSVVVDPHAPPGVIK